MNIQMTAQVDGRGKLTMESLAQAWDALNDRDVPPDAVVQVNTSAAAGRWVITARWTPADAQPDETEAQEAERVPLDSFGLPPRKTMAERLAENMEAIQDQLDAPLFAVPDPEAIARAVRGKFHAPNW